MRDYLEDDPYAVYDGRDRWAPAGAPHPGWAAVLSVLIPGLGQVYSGRLLAGALWFLATSFGYWAILVPGFLLHAGAVFCAYRGAQRWRTDRWNRY